MEQMANYYQAIIIHGDDAEQTADVVFSHISGIEFMATIANGASVRCLLSSKQLIFAGRKYVLLESREINMAILLATDVAAKAKLICND
jgi:hypothetical protein